jgi:hypothetical protein
MKLGGFRRGKCAMPNIVVPLTTLVINIVDVISINHCLFSLSMRSFALANV